MLTAREREAADEVKRARAEWIRKHGRNGKAWYGEIYLHSDWWRRRRAEALADAGGRCWNCGASGRRLEIHHRSYARLGCEAASDLRAICRQCHSTFHHR